MKNTRIFTIPFARPTIGKILLFIFFLLILPLFGWQNFICEPCPPLPAKCDPCGEYEFKFFGIPLLIIDALSPGPLSHPEFTSFHLPLNLFFILLVAYILSCFFIRAWNR
jgi:hypothetical protein